MSSTFEHLDIEFEEINKLGIAEIIALKGEGGVLSEQVKQTLLNCFRNVAWVDEHGQEYVNALRNALYPPAYLVRISATYTQSGEIYPTDSLDDLREDLVVTATYSNGVEMPITAYVLSGTLQVGESIITVSYGGKIAIFEVEVTRIAETYTITNNLTGASNSNSATYVTEGNSYSATITANPNHTLVGATVSITMGDVDITSTAYNDGEISIAEVTGDLVITVVAVAIVVISISAVYTQSGTVYDTDTLDDLRADLVVTATYSDSSTETIPSTDYTLSGTLEVGTSTITVSYGGKTDTFNVTVLRLLYANSTFHKKLTTGTITVVDGGFDMVSTGSASWNLYAFPNSNLPTYGELNGHTLRLVWSIDGTNFSSGDSCNIAFDGHAESDGEGRYKYFDLVSTAYPNSDDSGTYEFVLNDSSWTGGSTTMQSSYYVRYRVFLHGHNGASAQVRLKMYDLGILS